MGRFHTHITVSQGLPPDLAHLKGPIRKRQGLRRRTIDDSSVVDVEGWPLPGQRKLGALSYSVTSCNVCGNCVARGRWTPRIADAVEARLRNHDGLAKGRALFAFGEDFFGGKTAFGVLTYHLPRAGTIEVLQAEGCNRHLA